MCSDMDLELWKEQDRITMSKVLSLEIKTDELRAEFIRKKNEADALRAELVRKENEADILRDKLVRKENEANILRAEFIKKKNEVDALRDKLVKVDRLERENAKLREEVTTLKNKNVELSKALRRNHKDISKYDLEDAIIEHYSIQEIADYFKVSRNTIYNRIKQYHLENLRQLMSDKRYKGIQATIRKAHKDLGLFPPDDELKHYNELITKAIITVQQDKLKERDDEDYKALKALKENKTPEIIAIEKECLAEYQNELFYERESLIW